jgi:hypothetical protein
MTRSQLVVGTALITLGALLFADQAGAIDDPWGLVLRWWPLLFVASGVAQLVTRPRNVVGGIVMVTIGGLLLLWTVGPVASLALLWPALLIGLGLWLLLGRVGTGRRGSGPALDASAVFGDRHLTAPPGPFPGGSLTTLLGDLRVDLRATTLTGAATLQVTTILGDIDLEVPPNWRVEASGPELLGDVALRPEVGRAEHPDGTLRLRVLTLFGDVTVRASARAAHG